MINYKFCPQCNSDLDVIGKHPYCSHCDIHLYQDPKPIASVLPIKDAKVLLAKRAVEPEKGKYDTIGGFLDINEQPEETAIREAKEETGLDIKILELLCMHTDRYGKEGNHLINIYYVAEVIGGKLKAADDVESLKWFSVDKLPKMGFKSANLAAKDLQNWYKKKLITS